MLGEDPAHRLPVGDVPLHEDQAGVGEEVGEALQAPRVGQLVEDDGAGVGLGRLRKDEAHEVAADEPGAAGDQEGFHGRGSI